MKKQYKSSRIKNHKITKKVFLIFDGVPLKAYVASQVIFRSGTMNLKKNIVGISRD